ncbi:MAG: nucleotidyl transferase AbiEii/AbiGii toxin family protein [Bacteroidota bacterium]
MSYKINFESLRQEGLKPLFKALERGFNALEIDFYLVGAIARDTWFAHHGVRPLGTKDVDFAVYIPSKEKYEKLRKYLCEKEGFQTSSQNQFVIFSPEGLEVDLLPFGEIEVEGKVMMGGRGLTQIAVNGFREVYENGTDEVEFENDQVFKVCTLPGIVILKFIAYDDRPEVRQNDIKDITLILKHYFDIETDNIYELHNDLFEDDRDTSLIAARVLGRQMKNIFARSKDVEERITSIIQREISNPEKSKIGELMVAGTDNAIISAIEILKEILKGIQENET